MTVTIRKDPRDSEDYDWSYLGEDDTVPIDPAMSAAKLAQLGQQITIELSRQAIRYGELRSAIWDIHSMLTTDGGDKVTTAQVVAAIERALEWHDG